MKKFKNAICAFVSTLLIVLSMFGFAACDLFDEGETASDSLSAGEITASDESADRGSESERGSESASESEDPFPSDEHDYNVTVIKAPTKTEKGLAKAECKDCGKTKTAVLPEYSTAYYKVSGLENIQCSGGGEYDVYYTITVYGKDLLFHEKIKAGHVLSGVTVGENEIVTFSGKIPDSVKLFGNVEITCGDGGAVACFVCERCGQNILFKARKEHAPAGGLADSQKVYEDCELGGKSKTFKCATCGKFLSIKLPPRAHNYEYRLKESEGKFLLDKTCSVCNKKTISEVKNVVEESYVAPKCNEDGYKTCRVEVDGEVIKANIIVPKTGVHKFNGKEIDYDNGIFFIEDGFGYFKNKTVPYCDYTGEPQNNGYFSCSDCGKTVLTKVKRHYMPTDASKITYTKEGYKVYVCEGCGKQITDKSVG